MTPAVPSMWDMGPMDCSPIASAGASPSAIPGNAIARAFEARYAPMSCREDSGIPQFAALEEFEETQTHLDWASDEMCMTQMIYENGLELSCSSTLGMVYRILKECFPRVKHKYLFDKIRMHVVPILKEEIVRSNRLRTCTKRGTPGISG